MILIASASCDNGAMQGMASFVFVRLSLLVMAATLTEPSAVAAKDFCALTVELVDSHGAPAKLTPVRLIDSSGRTVFDEQIEGPTVRICDFGFGLHRLVAGYGFCYPVTISNLRLGMGRPIHLTVRLNACPPDIWGGSLCDGYLRVREPSGAAVPGARLRLAPANGTSDSLSDQYGRVESFLVGGSSAVATISKEGYGAQHMSLRCTQSEEIEREVLLTPALPR